MYVDSTPVIYLKYVGIDKVYRGYTVYHVDTGVVLDIDTTPVS